MTTLMPQLTSRWTDQTNQNRRFLAVVITLVIVAVAPMFLQQFHVGLLTRIFFMGLLAMSLNVLVSLTRVLSLGHAGLFGVAAYVVAIGVTRWELPFLTAAAVALVVTGLVSMLFAVMIVRAQGVTFVMITVAQGMLLWGAAERWVSVTNGNNGIRGVRPPEFIQTANDFYWAAFAVVAVSVFALWRLHTSFLGTRLRGTGDSPTRMTSLGYSNAWHRFIAFTIAGLFAGVAGILYVGYFGFVSPTTLHVGNSVQVALAVILGGSALFLGPLLGTAVLLTARTWVVPVTDRWNLIVGALMIVTVLFLPNGLAGAFASAWAKLTRRIPRLAGRRSPDQNAPSAPAEPPGSSQPSGTPERPQH
ncbi:branched-chain amino acid ABC transporter permease [Phytoactinopolyspora limicola]|uniref:branched-chain amino acid ABC transporter permease n=1 Tax=Phytoactinopolyspora limicola TaxID=2715536 RepID=UPI0014076CAB|nr:branched-chain amino acid ABC transporter permease [Phytoactinopolyspora limicola]